MKAASTLQQLRAGGFEVAQGFRKALVGGSRQMMNVGGLGSTAADNIVCSLVFVGFVSWRKNWFS